MIILVEYSFDPDIRFDRFRDDRRDERRLESMMLDAMRQIDRDTRPIDMPNPVMEVINNPNITLSAVEKKAINDPKMMMSPQGTIVKRKSGRDVIRSSGQFTNMGIPLPVKRTRKKTKMDKTMSICLKKANLQLRKKNGQLRKGKTMRDVMRLAHRLCKKS